MSDSLHPAASHYLPSFITAPGESDWLMSVTGLILLFSVVGFGILFLRLHTLPERVAHKSHKVQFEIVAILGLLALFTHMHIFWVAGLLLAFVDLPDFGGAIGRIAGSVEKMAGIKPGAGADEVMAQAENAKHADEAADEHSEAGAQARKSEPPVAAAIKPRTAFPDQKEKVRA
jgi:hypothetical protein